MLNCNEGLAQGICIQYNFTKDFRENKMTLWNLHLRVLYILFFCCSVTQSYPTLQPNGLQHARLACPIPSPGVCCNSCPLSQWCHPTISSSIIPFSCLQFFTASRVLSNESVFESCSQSIRDSTSASVLPMNIQPWFPLGLTGLISLLSKGLWIVFSTNTFWKYQLFDTQPFLLSSFHICTWVLEKP